MKGAKVVEVKQVPQNFAEAFKAWQEAQKRLGGTVSPEAAFQGGFAFAELAGDLGTQSPIVLAILAELDFARGRFERFNSAHEGFAVLKEEVDELWDSVRNNSALGQMRECVQVAAMSLRFLVDLRAAEVLSPDVRFFKDGDAWCAVRKDFTNLQESVAGFGPGRTDALIDLLKNEAKERQATRPIAPRGMPAPMFRDDDPDGGVMDDIRMDIGPKGPGSGSIEPPLAMPHGAGPIAPMDGIDAAEEADKRG